MAILYSISALIIAAILYCASVGIRTLREDFKQKPPDNGQTNRRRTKPSGCVRLIFIIKRLLTSFERSKKSDEEEDHHRYERVVADSTKSISRLTAGLVFVGIVGAFVAWRTLKAIEGQLRAFRPRRHGRRANGRSTAPIATRSEAQGEAKASLPAASSARDRGPVNRSRLPSTVAWPARRKAIGWLSSRRGRGRERPWARIRSQSASRQSQALETAYDLVLAPWTDKSPSWWPHPPYRGTRGSTRSQAVKCAICINTCCRTGAAWARRLDVLHNDSGGIE